MLTKKRLFLIILITITISFSISLDFDFNNITSIKISYNEEGTHKKNADNCVFVADSVESFEKRQLKRKEISIKQTQKLIELLKEIFFVIEKEDFFLDEPLDLSFIDSDDEKIKSNDGKKDIVYINDNYVDVKAIIYIESINGNITKVAVGSGSYVNIDGHYYKISKKYRCKLLKFIRNEIKN